MARSFDGSSGRLSYVLNANQKSLTTVSFHFRMYRSGAGEGGYGVVFAVENDNSNRKFRVENDNGDVGWGIAFIARHTTNGGVWSIAYPTANTWNDYVITYDGSSTSNDPIIYKDGVVATLTERVGPSGSLATTDANLFLGNNSADSQTWNGRICEFAMWNRVLSAAEASALGKGYSPLFTPNGLVSYIPMVGKNTAEPDYKSGLTASITSTSTIPHPSIIYPTPSQIRRYTTASTPPASSFFPSRRMMRGIGI